MKRYFLGLLSNTNNLYLKRTSARVYFIVFAINTRMAPRIDTAKLAKILESCKRRR